MRQRYAVTSDIHGCFAEFVSLLEGLGFRLQGDTIRAPRDGRRLLFAGDLTDRGPDSPRCLLLLQHLVEQGFAEVASLGNHDERLLEALQGKELAPRPLRSFTDTLRQLLNYPDPLRVRQAAFDLFAQAPRFSIYEPEQLLVVHGAAYPSDLEPDADPRGAHLTRGVRADEPDDRGRRARTYEWVKEWVGPAASNGYRVVIGHHPTPSRLPGLMARGRVIAVDTGCAMGGRLSAVLWPERRFLVIPSSVDYRGDGPRGISAPLQTPAAAKIARGRVSPQRTARWQAFVDHCDSF